MLADVDAKDSEANESEEVAATSLLHAKDAKRTVRSSTQSAHDAELEAQVCVCVRACVRVHVCVCTCTYNTMGVSVSVSVSVSECVCLSVCTYTYAYRPTRQRRLQQRQSRAPLLSGRSRTRSMSELQPRVLCGQRKTSRTSTST